MQRHLSAGGDVQLYIITGAEETVFEMMGCHCHVIRIFDSEWNAYKPNIILFFNNNGIPLIISLRNM